VPLSSDTHRHLRTVLRMSDGDACSYTDGTGLVGTGLLIGDTVQRGDEHHVTHPVPVTLAVAPPASKDRVRWMVEKACEVGVTRIRWLRTVHGEGRVPRHDKAMAWAQAALEQSRRAHLAEIDPDWTMIADLVGDLVVFDQAGEGLSGISGPVTVLVGPEGGWAGGELPSGPRRFTLGDGVLRTETAAIVGVHAVVNALR